MHRRSTLEEVYGPTRLPATQNGSVPNHVLSGVRILCCSNTAAAALPGAPTRKLLRKQLYCCAYPANEDDALPDQRRRWICQTSWIIANRNAVVSPNSSIPFSASSAPIICQCCSKDTLSWP